MNLKTNLSLLLVASLVALPSVAKQVKQKQKAAVTPVSVFMYSPGEKKGMNLAYMSGDKTYTDIGQLFSSDYSRWGSEKRMYSPFVTPLSEGGYAAVFQVNDYSPCFAVVYSADLTTWRPQDYPRVSSKGCIAPVIRKDSNGGYTILFKTKDGQARQVTTDALFRHFSTDRSATIAEYNKVNVQRDTMTVGDKTFVGNACNVMPEVVDKAKAYFAKIDSDNKKNGERLADDDKLLAKLGNKPVNALLKINADNRKAISDKLIGIFFEDISYAADGGLYAEMVQNRDFEYSSLDRREWTSTTSWRSSGGSITVAEANPLSINNPHYAVLTSDTLYNTGWDGFKVDNGARYDFSFFVKNIGGKAKKFTVALVAEGKILSSVSIKTKGKDSEWNKYSATLVPTADTDKAELMILPEKKNEVGVDMISLFPEDTFCGHKNGLRKDLAQTLADLHPKFVRFPGGCMSHGDGLDNIYHWAHSVGELQDRKPDRNLWNYHQTRGLGFYEYFQFCEDIDAEPLPVLAAGVPCQNSGPDAEGFGGQQGGIPMADMPAYVQEFLDLIEWANGDPATSKWAKMRADAGHPEPFNLKYIGVGNEDIISTVFEERCLMICKAIKERYPDIIVCGTVGPFHYPSSDYVEGWKFANDNKNVIDMVDEHYYESVGWFLNNQHYYDNYDRKGPKVYLGEYAARVGKGGLDCALAEAVHLCNIERNADVVTMTSYAPLLCNNKHSNWNPDMIYFDNSSIEKTPSYETQRLFSVYAGDNYIASSLTIDSIAVNRVATSVVRNSKTGKTYLKVANVLPTELNLTLSTKNLPAGNSMAYEGFSGKPGQRTVKLENGTCGVKQDAGLVITLPPYSFRVIEL